MRRFWAQTSPGHWFHPAFVTSVAINVMQGSWSQCQWYHYFHKHHTDQIAVQCLCRSYINTSLASNTILICHNVPVAQVLHIITVLAWDQSRSISFLDILVIAYVCSDYLQEKPRGCVYKCSCWRRQLVELQNVCELGILVA